MAMDTTTPASRRSLPSMSVLGPIIALVALVVIGALLNPNFLGAANITNVLARSAFIGIIAVGMTFVITAGGLDLSVGSMAAFIAGLMILVMNAALPTLGVGVPIILLGMATALAAGLIAGLINGFLITTLGIEAFIVTLGTMGIYRSLVTWLADGGTLSLDFGLRTFYRPVYFDGILGISWPIIVFALVVIGGEILMSRSRFGRHCAATGSNEHVAHYSNVNGSSPTRCSACSSASQRSCMCRASARPRPPPASSGSLRPSPRSSSAARCSRAASAASGAR